MKTINLTQGSPEWHQFRATHFTASDAPAMMGAGKYKNRAQLLREKATGSTQDVSAQQQALFDRGHAAEASARPIAEAIIGDELFPVTAESNENPKLAASFDGVTMDEAIIWEHKLWNESKAASVNDGQCPAEDAFQVQHQLLVSGAEKCLYMVSDGTEENCAHVWVYPNSDDQQMITAGWDQFAVDLDNYQHIEVQETPDAAPAKQLPAISYKLDGLALTSNLDQYREAAMQLVEDSTAPLETDQDFADREQLCKDFDAAEKKLAGLREQVIGEIEDVSAFCDGLDNIRELIRQARLNGQKLVKTRKDAIRAELIASGKEKLESHISGINATLGGKITMPLVAADFAGAIKNKRTIQSLHDAIDDELAKAKIDASQIGDKIRANLEILRTEGKSYEFLFADAQQLVTKDADDLRNLIKLRISEQKAEEQRRLDAERERVLAEEKRKTEQAQTAEPEKESPPSAAVRSEEPAKYGAKSSRPSDQAIIRAVAGHFGVGDSVAAKWIAEMDLSEAAA